jgi:hypothetical protein
MMPINLLTLLVLSSTVSAWAQQRHACPPLTVLNESDDREKEVAHRIMWNQHSRKRQSMQYRIIAAPACEDMARRMEQEFPDRFTFHSTKWEKFPDGTDNIEIGGFSPQNLLSGENVLFLASFHNNDVTLSQFQVIICLLQSFIESMTVVLPYYPVGTMERVTKEGTVATAATYAHMFSSLPNCGRPTRLMVYDLHTLQNRFYLVCILVVVVFLLNLRRVLICNCAALPQYSTEMQLPLFKQPFHYSRKRLWRQI